MKATDVYVTPKRYGIETHIDWRALIRNESARGTELHTGYKAFEIHEPPYAPSAKEGRLKKLHEEQM